MRKLDFRKMSDADVVVQSKAKSSSLACVQMDARTEMQKTATNRVAAIWFADAVERMPCTLLR